MLVADNWTLLASIGSPSEVVLVRKGSIHHDGMDGVDLQSSFDNFSIDFFRFYLFSSRLAKDLCSLDILYDHAPGKVIDRSRRLWRG